MYTCASCPAFACGDPGHEKMPSNCPMRKAEANQEILAEYAKEEFHQFYVQASAVEGAGYCQWTRLREVAELCKRMGYKRIGMAFCKGLHDEAKVIAKVLESHGLDVISVICKTGGNPKELAGLTGADKINPDAYEVMCNPIAQARFLNEQNTEFNIAVGLCVGHDSLFYKHSDALVTTLIAKDRVLAHNPVGAVYCAQGYYKNKLAPDSQ